MFGRTSILTWLRGVILSCLILISVIGIGFGMPNVLDVYDYASA